MPVSTPGDEPYLGVRLVHQLDVLIVPLMQQQTRIAAWDALRTISPHSTAGRGRTCTWGMLPCPQHPRVREAGLTCWRLWSSLARFWNALRRLATSWSIPLRSSCGDTAGHIKAASHSGLG